MLVMQLHVAGGRANAASASPIPVDNSWNYPLTSPPAVLRDFQAPASAYGAGHRGLDLLSTAGAVLLAPVGGTVAFNRSVAGKPVLVLSTTNGLRVSFEPACSQMQVGSVVSAGQILGSVCGGSYVSHCAPQLCVHWGVRNNLGYLSPRVFWGSLSPSRLLA